MLILKKESREVFKKPFGKLYSALDDIDKSYLEDHFIISIGDATTKNLLDVGIIPKIGIIDNKIERKTSNHNIKYDAITLNADNPSGTITDSLQATIKEALDLTLKSNVLIVVNGEEDLAVIPCVLMAPKSSIILYGQPGEGIVVVKVDKLKETAKKMLDNFKVEEVK
ncbi:MAG: GTP-dependent dephospho-CoA kinase family protein [Methanobacterium sp.]|uniref:GTP-dependent dephospho-CoA kinase family protein n=1 Tax=Methanobacterium sp. TaxID=2164 RepID=UPI003D65A4DE|nr:GTP-dependent dephospho-CoA kinase family protein [Methanobacterium sp.]